MNNSSENKDSTIRISAKKKQPIIIQSAQHGSSVNLMPTVEIVESSVIFHFVTLAQMEKMHIHCRNVGTISFVLIKGQDDFELRFSADSPQEIAGQLVIDDSIDLVDYVFDNINVILPSGYDVSKVLLDCVDANLLEADINWRLADLQQKANGVAKEATLGNVQDVLEYIEQGGMPEIAAIAKQGTNPNATLSEVQAKIGTPASGQGADLFAAMRDIALSATTLQELADAWSAMVTNRTTLGGYTFVDDSSAQNIGEVLARGNLVKSIDDDNITLLTHAFSGFVNLQSVKLQNLEEINVNAAFSALPIQSVQFPSLKSVNNSDVFYRCLSLTSVYVPNLEYIYGSMLQSCPSVETLDFPALVTIAGSNDFNGCSNLKRISMPNVSFIQTANTFAGCNKLIDIVIGSAMVTSFSLSTWSPTEALLNNSQTLLTPEDIAAGFTSNLEKLLYNIREHIAANLPVAPNTITFSAAVKAAILADQPTADAFTNKNWTIA